MNIAELHKKLLAAARANPPGEQVPYAFEKRVTALLAARATTDLLASWVRGLWRAAVPCAAIALLFGAWAFYHPAALPKTDDLSQNFETTLLASVDQTDVTQ
jgi:hypothetical protein